MVTIHPFLRKCLCGALPKLWVGAHSRFPAMVICDGCGRATPKLKTGPLAVLVWNKETP